MNVTKEEIKYRKLHNETDGGYLQMVSAERKEYVEAYASSRITENNVINTNFSVDGLLEKILDRDNMNQAFKKVKSNKGAGGVDKMGVDELLPYLKQNREQLLQSIKDGKYHPNPVRRVEIPKDNGKMRNLGIPTVVDRVIQQAIYQVLTPIFEEQFSDNSYGFRPRRSAHDVMKKCIANTNEGFKYVVDMDLEKYFDTVNQSKLIEILSRTINDGRVISLIHKYLRAGVVIKHTFKESVEGVPQGGPLSPLLSNIKAFTSRSNGWGNEFRAMRIRRYIQGWINYFKIADMKTLLKQTDEWMRRRLRMVYWKQWKKVRTKFKMLKHYGINEWKAWEFANTRKGYWRISNSPILSKSLDNQTLNNLGFLYFSDYYTKVCVN